MSNQHSVAVYIGDGLASYGFGEGHPFGHDRMSAFWDYACAQGVDKKVAVCEPVRAGRAVIERFHTAEYVAQVKRQSATGEGYLDAGDTPAFVGVYEAAAIVVGSTVDALQRIMRGEFRRIFIPIAGLHHARRDGAAGFCVFNDCGVAIETLRKEYDLVNIAYVDIDAHHGDGVFYAFQGDADFIFADLHEDGHYLYPGTGAASETGINEAKGTKLNIPMPPNADDQAFMSAWAEVERYLEQAQPEFILLQCGADSIAGDPITHLCYTPEAHAYAASRLCALADKYSQGRLLAMGGGGYNRSNLARAWTRVTEAMVDAGSDDTGE